MHWGSIGHALVFRNRIRIEALLGRRQAMRMNDNMKRKRTPNSLAIIITWSLPCLVEPKNSASEAAANTYMTYSVPHRPPSKGGFDIAHESPIRFLLGSFSAPGKPPKAAFLRPVVLELNHLGFPACKVTSVSPSPTDAASGRKPG